MQLNYTHAFVRALPASFEESLKLHPPPTPIDVALANKQHHNYTELLRKLVPNIHEIAADENHPDCVFIEDTAIIVGDTAIITHPGAESRRGEVGPVKEALVRLGFTDIHQLEPPATLDGGDVMYTGTALWVGQTSRTNAEAINQLRQALSDKCAVYPFTVQGGDCLHLKSVITALDSKVLVVADDAAGKDVVAQAEAMPELAGRHEYVYVPDMVASNILRISNHVVAQAGFPASEAIFQKLCDQHDLTLHTLDMSEMIKADGALTCCSLLIHWSS